MIRRTAQFACLIAAVGGFATARATSGPALRRVVRLNDAVRTAIARQPTLLQARAATTASIARADQAKAPLLPQASGTASYQRTTSNYAGRPGSVPSSVSSSSQGPSFDTFNYWNFGLAVTQLVFDFGQTTGKWRAAQATAAAQSDSERTTADLIVATVRTAFFGARAAKALVDVARDTLANQERHLQQVAGFVGAGSRPAIDLAQARTDVAIAKLQVVTADNAYDTARAQLNQAMGIESAIDFDVSDEALPSVVGEGDKVDGLVDEALKARPEVAVLTGQILAQERTLRAVRGGYGPTFGLSTGLTEAGTDFANMAWNWNIMVTMSWPFFQGGLTRAQEREAHATLTGLRAQRDAMRLQVRLEVEQAAITVRGAKAEIVANEQVIVSAKERLRLAEGRYAAGVGNAIELGDAQLALTTASARRVELDYKLAAARAQLERSLGRPALVTK